MEMILLFVVATLALAFISRNSLFSPGKHGFYRFIAWECILGLFVLNTGGGPPWSPPDMRMSPVRC